MNKGMIHGTEIRVEFASDENGFVELPPEAASEPWARIGLETLFYSIPILFCFCSCWNGSIKRYVHSIVCK